MRPDGRWCDIPGLGNITLCHPPPLLATGLVEAGRGEPSRQPIAARDQPSSFFASRIDCLFTAANCSCVSSARRSSRSGSAIGFTLAARFWNRCPTSSTGDELVRFTPAHAAFYPVDPRGGPPSKARTVVLWRYCVPPLDVETWEVFEQSLADGDLASDELHERRDVITRWEENLEDRRLIKHGLALYSDVEADREQRISVADRVRS